MEPLLQLWLLRATSRPTVARPLLWIRRLCSASRPAVTRPLSGSTVGREQGWGGREACQIRSPRHRRQQHQATMSELEAAAASSSQHDGSGELCRAAGKLWLLLVGEGERAGRRERRGGLFEVLQTIRRLRVVHALTRSSRVHVAVGRSTSFPRKLRVVDKDQPATNPIQ
ncbi:unnamed protein product [Urochloa humidicola]